MTTTMSFPSTPSGITLLTTQKMWPTVYDVPDKSIPELSGTDNCLGGFHTMTPLPTNLQSWTPSLYGSITAMPNTYYGGQIKLFRDITPEELVTGITLYRAIGLGYSGNEDADPVVNLTITADTTTSVSTAATVTMAISAESVSIDSETTAPPLAFSNPLTLSGSYASYTSDWHTSALLWIKYVVAPLASPANFYHNFFGLRMVETGGNYQPAYYYFYNNWQADSFISSVTSNKQDDIVGMDTIIKYTVICKSAAGSATDFDGTTRGLPVMTSMSSPYPRRDYAKYEPVGFKDGFTQMNIARRTATGTYVLEWKPPFPGVFKHCFSLGYDEYNYTQWVVPHVR